MKMLMVLSICLMKSMLITKIYSVNIVISTEITNSIPVKSTNVLLLSKMNTELPSVQDILLLIVNVHSSILKSVPTIGIVT